MTLQRTLNDFFTPKKPQKRKPKKHIVYGVEVSKVLGLWTAVVDGQIYRNSHLCDLKAQLAKRA